MSNTVSSFKKKGDCKNGNKFCFLVEKSMCVKRAKTKRQKKDDQLIFKREIHSKKQENVQKHKRIITKMETFFFVKKNRKKGQTSKNTSICQKMPNKKGTQTKNCRSSKYMF